MRIAMIALTGLVVAWLPARANAQQLLTQGPEFQVNTYVQGNQIAAGGRAVAHSSDGSFIVT